MIATTFDEDMHKILWGAAGWKYYEAASNENWRSLNNLMVSGMAFINQYSTELAAKNKMPKAFPAQFKEAKEKFTQLNDDFIVAELAAQQLTGTKIKANNACYDKLMDMFGVAVRAFNTDEAIRREFTFSEIELLVAGAGTSGFNGKVLDIASGKPMTGVTVSIEGRTMTRTTDVDGRYEFLQVASGTLVLTFYKKGYMPQTLQIVTEPGVEKRLEALEMQVEMVMEVMPEVLAPQMDLAAPLQAMETTTKADIVIS